MSRLSRWASTACCGDSFLRPVITKAFRDTFVFVYSFGACYSVSLETFLLYLIYLTISPQERRSPHYSAHLTGIFIHCLNRVSAPCFVGSSAVQCRKSPPLSLVIVFHCALHFGCVSSTCCVIDSDMAFNANRLCAYKLQAWRSVSDLIFAGLQTNLTAHFAQSRVNIMKLLRTASFQMPSYSLFFVVFPCRLISIVK
jgi:hypothetical protein